MPRAYGSDRVLQGRDGRVLLITRGTKGWSLRKERTLTSPEHPGTAVHWDGALYEVLDCESAPGGGVRYTLALWKDEHVIRLHETYDEANEGSRSALERDIRASETTRRSAIALSVLTGHLPGHVQEAMHRRYGTPPVLLTVISCVPLLVFGVACIGWLIAQRMHGTPPPIPRVLVSAGLFFFLESALRLMFAARLARPVGSLLGSAGYSIWYLLSPRRASLDEPFPRLRPQPPLTGPPSDVALEDRYRMLEPFLALLPAPHQDVFRLRFGFDPVGWGRVTAVVILAFSGAGALTSLLGLLRGSGGLITVPSLLIATSLVVEQIVRLRVLRTSRPAGSFLGALVRPLARTLLEQARALSELNVAPGRLEQR